MNRLLTLIWAIGVMLFASQAQAVTSKDEVGVVRKAELSETEKKGSEARTKRHKASSTTKSRRAWSKKRTRVVSKTYRSRTHYKRTASVSKRKRKTSRVASRQHRAYRSASGRSHALHGMASYYWQPQRVASGGWFNPRAMTAAHKTLPFGTRVRVTNKRNGRTVDVTINDRGPYIGGRIIDLSSAAAGAIGMKSAGVVPVSVEVIGR